MKFYGSYLNAEVVDAGFCFGSCYADLKFGTEVPQKSRWCCFDLRRLLWFRIWKVLQLSKSVLEATFHGGAHKLLMLEFPREKNVIFFHGGVFPMKVYDLLLPNVIFFHGGVFARENTSLFWKLPILIYLA